MKKFESKVNCFFGNDNQIEDYKVVIDPENNVFAIIAPEGTCGVWSWSYKTMCAGYSDKLFLDFGQNWYVKGLEKVWEEFTAYFDNHIALMG